MAIQGGLLTRRALVLAKVETVCGEDALPTAADDAVLVSEPEFTIDPQILERDFVSNDLSSFASVIGRIVSGFQFTVDFRNLGVSQSGLVADAPILATLLRGCGYELLPMGGTGDGGNHGSAVPDFDNDPTGDGNVAWASTSDPVTVEAPVLYTIEVTTGGASGVAQVTITGNNDAEDDLSAAAPQTVTSGTALALGAKGGQITPTFTNDLILGDKYSIIVFPTGVKAKPISTGFETLTLYMFRDGLRFRGYAGQGTFNIEAVAGDFARITFNFTTTYVQPDDTPVPTNPGYGLQLKPPPQVELSLLTWGGNVSLVAEQWSLDQGNDVQVRPDVNAPQGFAGSLIVDREVTGGFNPESVLEADNPFWDDFARGRQLSFTARIGSAVGEQVIVFCPQAQTNDLQFGDRNGTLTYEKGFQANRFNGDDELCFVFA